MERERDRSWVPPLWLLVLGGVLIVAFVIYRLWAVYWLVHRD